MVRTDIITIFPRQARYGVWETMMYLNWEYFQQIIVVLTNDEMYSVDHSYDLKYRWKEFTYLSIENAPNKTPDWRNTATNYALANSTAEGVLFLEPDFFIRDLQKVFDGKHYDLSRPIGVKIGDRIHPCFLYVPRETVEKTDKDFSAYPERDKDHFDSFTEQLSDIQFLDGELWYHMAGLTHNMRLENQGEMPVYKPDEYRLYKVLESIITI